MTGAYLAISCTTSALTRNQVVSFIISLVICLLLILAGFAPVIDAVKKTWLVIWWPGVVDFAAAFSFITHFENFQKGILDSRDIVFFLSVMGFSLFTTGVILRGHRAG